MRQDTQAAAYEIGNKLEVATKQSNSGDFNKALTEVNEYLRTNPGETADLQTGVVARLNADNILGHVALFEVKSNAEQISADGQGAMSPAQVEAYETQDGRNPVERILLAAASDQLEKMTPIFGGNGDQVSGSQIDAGLTSYDTKESLYHLFEKMPFGGPSLYERLTDQAGNIAPECAKDLMMADHSLSAADTQTLQFLTGFSDGMSDAQIKKACQDNGTDFGAGTAGPTSPASDVTPSTVNGAPDVTPPADPAPLEQVLSTSTDTSAMPTGPISADTTTTTDSTLVSNPSSPGDNTALTPSVETTPPIAVTSSTDAVVPADSTPSVATTTPIAAQPSDTMPADTTLSANTTPSTDTTLSSNTTPSADTTLSTDTTPSTDTTSTGDSSPATVAPLTDAAPLDSPPTLNSNQSTCDSSPGESTLTAVTQNQIDEAVTIQRPNESYAHCAERLWILAGIDPTGQQIRQLSHLLWKSDGSKPAGALMLHEQLQIDDTVLQALKTADGSKF